MFAEAGTTEWLVGLRDGDEDLVDPRMAKRFDGYLEPVGSRSKCSSVAEPSDDHLSMAAINT